MIFQALIVVLVSAAQHETARSWLLELRPLEHNQVLGTLKRHIIHLRL
jgi:hypothetical protein